MRIVLLGAGLIGQAIVRDLANGDDVTEIVVADLDERAAREAAAVAGEKGIPVPVNVTDRSATAALLRGADACVNAVPYRFNLDVMRACLDAGVPYLDLGGLFHMTRRQLELDEDFRRAGLTAVLGMGSCPGVANVQARYLADLMDTVRSVRIYNGSTAPRSDSLAWAYSLETILDEISQPAVVFRDGRFQEVPPLSEEEFFLFPEPIGYAKTHLSLHSEVATLPLSLAHKGVREVTFKITFFGYTEAALRKLQFLAELGLASTEPIQVDGVPVRPRDVLVAVLRRSPQSRPAESLGFKAIVTVAEGTRRGRPVRYAVTTSAWPHQRWGMSGSKLLVAAPAAVLARWLAQGTLSTPGVHPPETVVPPEPFFAALAERGAQTRLAREEPLHPA